MSETNAVPGGIAFGPACDESFRRWSKEQEILESSMKVAEHERRRLACEVACAGIPTEALERGALKHVIDLAAWPYEGEHGSRCEEHEEGCPDCEMVAALVAIGRLK